MLLSTLKVMCLYASTSRSKCAVPSVDFFSSSLISCFARVLSEWFWMVQFAPGTTGIILLLLLLLLLLLYGLFSPFIGPCPLRFRVFETTVLLWRQAAACPAPKWKARVSLFFKQQDSPVEVAQSAPRLTPASLAKQFLGWSSQGGWGWRDLGYTWGRK